MGGYPSTEEELSHGLVGCYRRFSDIRIPPLPKKIWFGPDLVNSFV